MSSGTGFQFSKKAVDLMPLRCARCLAKGHNCYTDRVDDNKQPICVFCEDGEPCFWEQHNRNSGEPVPPQPQLITRKESSHANPASPAQKTNGHASAIAQRLCKCGCGETVRADQRFAYVKGHMKRAGKKIATKVAKREKCECGRPLGHTGKHRGGQAAAAWKKSLPSAPLVVERVSLALTETQLNAFLVRLSLREKQRLATYFLETAEG